MTLHRMREQQSRQTVSEIAPLHRRPMHGMALVRRELSGLADLDETAEITPPEERRERAPVVPKIEKKTEAVEAEEKKPAAEETPVEEKAKPVEEETPAEEETKPVQEEEKPAEEKKAAEEKEPGKKVEEEAKPAEESPEAEGAVVVAEASAAPAEEEAEKRAPEAATAGADLRAWRAGVSKRIASIPPPKPPDITELAAKMQKAAADSQSRSTTAAQKAPEQIKAALPPAPKSDAPAQPPPNPVPEATKRVAAKSDRKLRNQTIPVVQQPPGRPVRLRFGPPVLPAEVHTSALAPGGQEGETKAGETPGEKKIAAVNARADVGVQNADREGKGEALVLVDEGKPQPAPIPPASKEDVGGVLAVLVAGIGKDARDIVARAEHEAFPNEALVDGFPEFVDDLAPDVEQALQAQFYEIRDQAGISKNELDQKVAQRRADLLKIQATSEQENEHVADANRTAIQTGGQKTLDAQAGARKAADELIEQQQEAASGTVDPQVIRSKAARLKRDLSMEASRQAVAYVQAGERRTNALDQAGQTIVAQYNLIARSESKAIADEEKAKGAGEQEANDAAMPLLQWVQERLDETSTTFGDLRKAAAAEAATFQQEVRTAGDEGMTLIDEWANGQIAEHSSWWDRLLDLFRNWATKASTDAQAWEEASTAATKDAIVGDLAMMKELQSVNAAAVDASTLQQQAGFSTEQRAILQASFEGPEKGNPLAAIAVGIRLRLYDQRKPALFEAFKKKLIEAPKSDWRRVAKIGVAERSDFDAFKIASEAFQAMDRIGTDEERIYRALQSLTPIQAAAVRKCYEAEWHSNLDEDLVSELGGDELKRAQSLLAADQTAADVAALHYAISGWGADEATVMRVLRGKSLEECRKILAAYEATYGASLKTQLSDKLKDHDLKRANALLEANTAKADAIALDEALRGHLFGADKGEIARIYAENRAEVEAEGARSGWNTEKINAEIKRRNALVEQQYQTEYAPAAPIGDKSALRTTMEANLSGAQRELAIALHENNVIAADAARIKIEEQGVYTDDVAVNKILRSQRERARTEVERDLTLDLQKREQLDLLAGRKWSDQYREAQRQATAKKIDQETDTRTASYLSDLENTYDKKHSFWGRGGLRAVIELNMSGDDRREARAIMDQSGKLTTNQEIEFATAAQDKERLQRLFAGKTRNQIATIREEWNSAHKDGESFDQRVLGAVDGRDKLDMAQTLQGEPQTLEERIARAEQRLLYEKTTGGIGSLFSRGERERAERSLEALKAEKARADKLKEKDPAAYARAVADFKLEGRYFDRAIDDHRKAIDSATDTAVTIITTAVAVIVIVVIGLATGGLGFAAIPALAPAAGFLTSTGGAAAVAAATATLTIGTKAAFKGGAYGGRELRKDLTVGAADALVSAATAGMGGKVLKLVVGDVGRRALPTRVVLQGLAQGGEGFIQGAVPAFAGGLVEGKKGGALLDETLGGGAMGGIFGAGLGAGGEIFGAAKKALKTKELAPSTDLLAHRGTPADRKAMFADFVKENPSKTYRDFLKELDARTIAKQVSEDEKRLAQRSLRKELFEGIPPAQRKHFQGIHIQELSDTEFHALTGSRTKGQAAVLIEGGRPRVVKRKSAPGHVLREEGHHLVQTLEESTAKQMRKLDEKVLAKWDRLSLEKKLQLVEAKLRLEVDAHQRLIKDLKKAIEEVGENAAARKALLSQLEDAETNLRNLGKRLGEMTSFTPLERKAMAKGALEPPSYVEKPPRLFSKKERPASAYRRADPNAPREKLTEHTMKNKLEPGDEVYKVGHEWAELKKDGSVRSYREVEIIDKDGVKKFVREEAKTKKGRWHPRGQDVKELGEIGEKASAKLIEQQAKELAEKGITRKALGGGGSRKGFDNVVVDFKREGGVLTVDKVVVVEAKHYSGAVSKGKFAPVTTHAKQNLEALEQELSKASRDPTHKFRTLMTKSEVDAARKALREGNIRVELHLGPATTIAAETKLIRKIKAHWQKRSPGMSVTKVGIPPEMINEASAAILAQDAIGTKPRFFKVMDVAKGKGLASGPYRLLEPRFLIDQNDRLLSLKVLSPPDVAPLRVRQTAADIVELLKKQISLPSKYVQSTVTVLLDMTVLSPQEQKMLQKSLRNAIRETSSDPRILQRLQDLGRIP